MIMQAQLDALSQVMVWEDAEKPQWDMASLLIMLSIATGYERVFSLVAVWAHPHQASYTTLEEAAHKLMLLMDGSTHWVYTFIQLNEAL